MQLKYVFYVLEYINFFKFPYKTNEIFFLTDIIK